jgi:hypothetical protein
MLGCPILRALREGWDKQNQRGRDPGATVLVSHPSQRARRMGHPGTRLAEESVGQEFGEEEGSYPTEEHQRHANPGFAIYLRH